MLRGSLVLAKGSGECQQQETLIDGRGRIRAASSVGKPIDQSAPFNQKSDLAPESTSHILYVK